MLFEKPTILEM